MNVPELKAKARPGELQWPGALTRALVVSAQDRTARVPRNASNPVLVYFHYFIYVSIAEAVGVVAVLPSAAHARVHRTPAYSC